MLIEAPLRPFVVALTFLWTAVFFFSQHARAFQEQLQLTPLPRGSVLASFEFVNSLSQRDLDSHNYHLFPRSLAQILHHAHVKELHLRFTTGRWDEDTWGRRLVKDGSTGVEIWAWIDSTSASADADPSEVVKKRWSTLVNSISGLFCASVHYVDVTRTITPTYAFEPQSKGAHTKSWRLLHGMLPNEVVCTENLTPFMKLLPCKGKAGISSLFDGHRLFDSNWQNLAVDVRTVCSGPGETECRVELEQTVSMVLDIERSSRPLDDPLPRPLPLEQLDCNIFKGYNIFNDTCFPNPRPDFPAFNISQIFGHAIKGSCPLSEEAVPSVCVTPAAEQTLTVQATESYGIREVGSSTCYSPSENGDFDIALSRQKQASDRDVPHLQPRRRPLIKASRTLTGRGQEHGGMRSVLVNPSLTDPVTVVYLETLPWFLRPYMHTLRAEVRRNDGNEWPAELEAPSNPITDMIYKPAIDRKRATHIELTLQIPAASTVLMNYDVDKSVLRYTEYPPDANRGFDLPAAIVRVISPVTSDTDGTVEDSEAEVEGRYVRTTTLLLYLMTPDFSMPYNVIILTSTVIALGFGSVFNLLVRRLVTADEAAAVAQNSALARLLALVAVARGRVLALVTANAKKKAE